MILVGACARNAYLRPRLTDDVDFLVRSLDDVRTLLRGVTDFTSQEEPDLVCAVARGPA